MLSLIVNPASGGGRAGRALPAVRAELDRHGLAHSVHETRSLDHARGLARDACAAGATAVAFGGDGVVGAVAGAVASTDGTLGILPGGRGNDFARVLGLPIDPVAACAVLASGATDVIDLGAVAGQPFACIASCGFDSVANEIANHTRVVRGSLVYVYAGLRALLGWRAAQFTVTLDGEPRSFAGYTVAVANGASYGGGMRLAPDASLRDGEFDVVLVHDASRLRFLRNLPKVFAGTHLDEPIVEVVRARHVKVSADRPFSVYADGDPVGTLPAEFSVLPGAVRAIVGTGR